MAHYVALMAVLLQIYYVKVDAVVKSPVFLNAGRDQLARAYFFEGYEYRVIVCFLHFVHGISLSVRQLKRILRRLRLRRRPRGSTSQTFKQHVRNLIKEELKGTGSLLGYRALWLRLRQKYNIPVPRDMVMRMLRVIDPEDSTLRRKRRLHRRIYVNKGPNYVWHCDGLDKIKHYGFAIHACIDGYSRRVLWLQVSSSNSNPAVIAKYYTDCVRQLQGTCRVLRCDPGTENTTIAFLQPFLRRHGTDCFGGDSSFRYGRSVANQRIEAWWSHLRKWWTQWWIELFKCMEDSGLLNEANIIHLDCIRFCFMHLIQKELNDIAHLWNTHRIRSNRHANVPAGVPDELYFMPTIQGTMNYLCRVDLRDLSTTEQYTEVPDPPAPLEFLQLVQILMEEENLQFPNNISDALELYVHLVLLIANYV